MTVNTPSPVYDRVLITINTGNSANNVTNITSTHVIHCMDMLVDIVGILHLRVVSFFAH